jgi:hypothetical protein
MLPVWLHHLPAHLVHPARRVRLLTAQTHAALLAAPLLRPGLTEDAPDVVGSVWALAAHDAERAVAAIASAPAARVQPEDKGPLLAFLERVLLQPDGVYNELNPPAPTHAPDPKTKQRPTGVAPTPAPPPRTKGDEQDESAVDRRARLRIAAFGALRYLLGMSFPTSFSPFYSPAFSLRYSFLFLLIFEQKQPQPPCPPSSLRPLSGLPSNTTPRIPNFTHE